jgi:sec-independent protein translocase protein TatA
MLKSIGLPELCVIFVIALLLFGAKRVPELLKGVGDGIRNFKVGLKTGHEVQDDLKKTAAREAGDIKTAVNS